MLEVGWARRVLFPEGLDVRLQEVPGGAPFDLRGGDEDAAPAELAHAGLGARRRVAQGPILIEAELL